MPAVIDQVHRDSFLRYLTDRSTDSAILSATSSSLQNDQEEDEVVYSLFKSRQALLMDTDPARNDKFTVVGGGIFNASSKAPQEDKQASGFRHSFPTQK
jgi:hypothetical protein